ncbi:hypothetical protein AURDEDRAFT_161472 [Auricularia subglabra TFB-10046 SS5]|nr:hypothetical protein AURDEDRAFT_161472 [Auricularia subglabra TFB-10046 SS5]
MGIETGRTPDVSGQIALVKYSPVRKHFLDRLSQRRRLSDDHIEWRFLPKDKTGGYNYAVEVKDIERNSVLGTGYGKTIDEAIDNAAKSGLQNLGFGYEAAQF